MMNVQNLFISISVQWPKDFIQLSLLDHMEKGNGSHGRSSSGKPHWWDRAQTTRHSKAHALVTGSNADNHCGPSNGIEFKWFPTPPPPAFGNENGNLNMENWLLAVVGNIKAACFKRTILGIHTRACWNLLETAHLRRYVSIKNYRFTIPLINVKTVCLNKYQI